jgi:hypothetical protein
METRSACEPTSEVQTVLAGLAAAHAGLDNPEGMGRAIGDPH